MSRKKVVILGCTGMLGHMVFRYLSKTCDIYGIIREKTAYSLNQYGKIHSISTLTDYTELKKLLKDIKPDFIINCVGIIKQVIDDFSITEIYKINAELPKKLAEISLMISAKLIHFSTDCVFSGNKNRPYVESDESDIEKGDIYGQSKLQGEIKNINALTLRTSFIGPEIKGKKSLFEWVRFKTNSEISGYSNVLYSGTTTLEMAKVLETIIYDYPELNGLYHFGSEYISKYNLIKIINSVYNLNIVINEDPKPTLDRRLDITLFKTKTGYKTKSWKQLITEMKEFYA